MSGLFPIIEKFLWEKHKRAMDDYAECYDENWGKTGRTPPVSETPPLIARADGYIKIDIPPAYFPTIGTICRWLADNHFPLILFCMVIGFLMGFYSRQSATTGTDVGNNQKHVTGNVDEPVTPGFVGGVRSQKSDIQKVILS
jgi:hypothetical protein